MANDVFAETLAQVQYKLDLIIRHLKIPAAPMHFQGHVCPVCNAYVDYQVDVMKGIVMRACNCKTGKIASLPLTPVVPTGETHVARYSDAPAPAESAPDRPRR